MGRGAERGADPLATRRLARRVHAQTGPIRTGPAAGAVWHVDFTIPRFFNDFDEASGQANTLLDGGARFTYLLPRDRGRWY